MSSARLLTGLAVACAVGAAAPARAAAPAAAPATPAAASFDLTDAFEQAATRVTAWVTDPTLWSVGLAALPVALVVEVRDVVARLTDRTQTLLALLPAPALPDLTVLTASPVPGHESSGFGWRMHPILHYRKFHAGTDFKADRGTPVYAAGTGVVAFAGVKNGYGKLVCIDHGGGIVTRYAHLSAIQVKQGAAITAATQLGRVGATGRATGPHLHFEVRIDDSPVDPTVAMRVAALERTDPGSARLAAWLLTPEAQADKVDAHDRAPARARGRDRHDRHAVGRRPERRGAPVRNHNRS